MVIVTMANEWSLPPKRRSRVFYSAGHRNGLNIPAKNRFGRQGKFPFRRPSMETSPQFSYHAGLELQLHKVSL
jgi:hypothetical protein